MKLKKLTSGLLVLALSASLLAACGTKSTDNGSKDTASYPGTSEKNAITVNISSEPPEMFSVTTTDTTSFTVLRHIIENLVTLDENDQVKPGVAKDWTVSDDGLVYTFNLREDMKWSNGDPVTAHDFVFAWTALLTPEFASDYAYFGYVFKNGLAYNQGTVGKEELGFKALSDYQLEVTLENPTSYFLDTLAFGVFAPVNEKAYNEFGDAYGTDFDKMLYNGPFIMTSWEHENKIVLEKNPDYYNADKIELEKINMVMINDSNAAMNAFKAGEVDVIGVNGDQAKMMKNENYPVYQYSDGSTFYLEYNLNNEYLQNDNLRKAITYAIDKQAFIDNIVKNDSVAAVSFTAPAVNGLEKKFKEEVGELVPVVDVEKAKEYYQTALNELGVDSVSFSMIADDTDAAMLNSAFIQEQLKVNLGIDITIETMPFKSRLERMSNKDFEIVFSGWGPDYNDPMTFLDMFETGNGNNHGSYSNPEYDELLNKVRTELDTETRFGYLVELEKIVMEDLPVGPIYWRSRDYIVSEKIESGVIRSAFQDMNFRFVKLAK
ncbi:MAG TPA: peptide ABC transporter substrate-binding protein [Clostridiales bacterium]|jgi:oligopeptide transport system substrate-binding protein|nr:peptide ABC transporter substrate-binding protein [Clostridiales bacterium]